MLFDSQDTIINTIRNSNMGFASIFTNNYRVDISKRFFTDLNTIYDKILRRHSNISKIKNFYIKLYLYSYLYSSVCYK